MQEVIHTIPPYHLSLDGADVYIVEIVEQSILDGKIYIASMYVEWKCYRSNRFFVMASNEKELIAKIRAEIAKMKAFIFSGNEHLFTKVC